MYPENHGIISNAFENPYSKERYRLGDTLSLREDKWYLGEAFWETAERQGIKTASYFWPGSEVSLKYRSPTYRMYYDHDRPYEQRIEGVLQWLQLPYAERPHFIILYFHDTDSYGHEYGPNSPQVDSSIQRLDSLVGILYNGLVRLNLEDSADIIITSDHGMTEVSSEKVINIENILCGYEYDLQESGPMMMLEPQKNEVKEVYQILEENKNHYRVYTKENIPSFYHFSKHPFIPSIIVIADVGWSLVTNKILKRMEEKGTGGNHGYEKDHIDMHGIFIARGPSFKKGYETGTLWNIDIYPLLCKIFNILPRSNIDGRLERIEFILNEN